MGVRMLTSLTGWVEQRDQDPWGLNLRLCSRQEPRHWQLWDLLTGPRALLCKVEMIRNSLHCPEFW